MQLSKPGYYADFVVYPILIGALTIVEFRTPGAEARLNWLMACATGVVGWTLIEYCIHRFFFHHFPIIARIHDGHHNAPSALIGAPLWSSLGAIALGVFLPLWWRFGTNVASGATTGLALGYLWYAAVHVIIHRWRVDPTSFLYPAKIRHMQHHHSAQDGNYGVTTLFWDRLFGTVIES